MTTETSSQTFTVGTLITHPDWSGAREVLALRPCCRGAAVPNPADWSPQDMRDLYSAFGWIGTGALGLMLAVTVAFVPEPSYWWHIPIAATAAVLSLVPWIGAAGTLRYLHRTHTRARARHADVFRGGH